jgi:hypothetical protein
VGEIEMWLQGTQIGGLEECLGRWNHFGTVDGWRMLRIRGSHSLRDTPGRYLLSKF